MLFLAEKGGSPTNFGEKGLFLGEKGGGTHFLGGRHIFRGAPSWEVVCGALQPLIHSLRTLSHTFELSNPWSQPFILSVSDLGHHDLVKDEAWDQEKLMHTVWSIAPNAPKMFEDLKSDVPQTADRAKLELWTAKWKEKSSRAKRGKDPLAPESLPKHVKTVQDTGPDTETSLAGTRRIQINVSNNLLLFFTLVYFYRYIGTFSVNIDHGSQKTKRKPTTQFKILFVPQNSKYYLQ